MKIRISVAAAIALFLVAPLTASRAQATGMICNDGTTSAAVGKGACSGHGGVRTATKASPTAQAKTAAVKPANKTKTGDTKTKASTKSETKVAPKTKAPAASETKMGKPETKS